MKLWLLRPVDYDGDGSELPPWIPGYDTAFGFVVRAETDDMAREIAASNAGDEGAKAWTDRSLTSCVELSASGTASIIMRDFTAG